jgi:hypothetical protein
MRLRDFFGILIAFVADGIQIGTTLISLGTDQLLVPVQVVFSAIVSAILALVMGPDRRLLPAIIELLPAANVVPGFSVGAIWLSFSNARKKNKGEPSGEP